MDYWEREREREREEEENIYIRGKTLHIDITHHQGIWQETCVL